MLKQLEYAYEIEFCAYLEKPTAELTWDELTIECAHPFTNCAQCEHCRQIQKTGTFMHDTSELAF